MRNAMFIPQRMSAAALALALCLGVAAAAETDPGLFKSVVTAENLDLANTAEFPANPAFRKVSEKFWLSLLGIRGTREEARYGWQTGATDKLERYLRVAFKEKLPVGTVIGGGGTLSFLKADASFPGDVTDNRQWETVPLPKGQAGMWVYTLPPGVVTRALRWSFSVSPMPGKTSQSGISGAIILASRLHNLSPEAEAFASSEFGPTPIIREFHQVQNLVTDAGLRGYQALNTGFSPLWGSPRWKAAPTQDVSPEHPQWVVLAWPEAKTFSGVGLLNASAKEIEVDASQATPPGTPPSRRSRPGARSAP